MIVDNPIELMELHVSACALALALLIDVSASVTAASFELQRDATAAGLETHEVLEAVRSAPIAVMSMQWSYEQKTSLPWTVLATEADVHRAADALRSVPRLSSGETGMGSAVIAALREMEHPPCEPDRRVIDVSGDGSSNHGLPISRAREMAISMSVTLNGLPIVTAAEPDVAEWYRDNLPTPDGFVVVAQGWESFAEAIRRKLLMEIAEASPLQVFTLGVRKKL